MAGKRINKLAPLTAAEKQKRHREKKADEKNAATDDKINRLRELFIEEIKKLPPDELLKLINLKDNPPKYPDLLTMKEICALAGISEYEFKKLEREGVITPEEDDPYSRAGFTKAEISRIEEKTGLTKDEFLCFLQSCEEPMTLSERSKKTNIPLRKLEEMDRRGIFKPHKN
jgi:DNA-binding transcriptional MerR regulator